MMFRQPDGLAHNRWEAALWWTLGHLHAAGKKADTHLSLHMWEHVLEHLCETMHAHRTVGMFVCARAWECIWFYVLQGHKEYS